MPDLLQHLFAGVCGQNLAHTWTPGGVPLPCCQRCTGLYVGALAGAALHLWFKPRLTSRFLWIHGVFLLQMIPFGFHWLPQGPFVRTITGTLFGFGLVSFFWLLPTARRPVGDGVHPEVLGAPASGPARSCSGLGPVHSRPEAGAPQGGTASSPAIWGCAVGEKPTTAKYFIALALSLALVLALANANSTAVTSVLAILAAAGLLTLAVLVLTNLWLLAGQASRLSPSNPSSATEAMALPASKSLSPAATHRDARDRRDACPTAATAPPP